LKTILAWLSFATLVLIPIIFRAVLLYTTVQSITLFCILWSALYLVFFFLFFGLFPRGATIAATIALFAQCAYYGMIFAYHKYFGIVLSRSLFLQFIHDIDKDSIIHVGTLYLKTLLPTVIVLMFSVYFLIKFALHLKPLSTSMRTGLVCFFVGVGLVGVALNSLAFWHQNYSYSVYSRSKNSFIATFGFIPYMCFLEEFGARALRERSVYKESESAPFELRVSRGAQITNETGIYEGPFEIPGIRYVFVIQVESLDNAVIDLIVQGMPVAPFLSSLKTRPNTVYFPSFLAHHYVGSADTDYSVLSGLDPENERLTYSLPLDHLNSLPRELSKHAIPTYSFQGIRGDFFYYKKAHEELGIATMHERSSFFPKEQGWLVNDAVFFDNVWRLIEPITEQHKRALFYCITMQSHNPFYSHQKVFSYDNKRSSIEIDYFNSIKEVDTAIQNFFYILSQKPYANETAVIIIGDHISQVITSTYSCWGAWPRTFDNVPLFISVPGIQHGIAETTTSSIDLASTIADLFEIPSHPDWHGNNVFLHQKTAYLHYRDGVAITNDTIVFVNGDSISRPRAVQSEITPDMDALMSFFAFSKKQFVDKYPKNVPSNWFRTYVVKEKTEDTDTTN